MMLDDEIVSLGQHPAGRPDRPDRRSSSPALRRILAIVGLLAIVATILLGRGWGADSTDPRPTATSPGGGAGRVPVSAEIESRYGIRFTTVAVTAGGGMIEIQYQVLDSDKTSSIHDPDVAPFIVGSDGHEYADPGMVGHSHIGKEKAAGTTDYILLANAGGGVTSGSIVTIRVGDLELRNVAVL